MDYSQECEFPKKGRMQNKLGSSNIHLKYLQNNKGKTNYYIVHHSILRVTTLNMTVETKNLQV